MTSEERAAEIAAVFYHEWSAEYRSLKLRIQSAIDAAVEEEITTLRATVAGLEAERDGLRTGLDKIVRSVPATTGGGCFYERYDGEGEYIGDEQVDPLSVIGWMAEAARTALGGEAAAKARDGKGG